MGEWIKRRSDILSKHFGTRQFTVDEALKTLQEYAGPNGETFNINKNQVIGVISALVKNNKVTKSQNPQDRRKKFYRFVPAEGQKHCLDHAGDECSLTDPMDIVKLTFLSTFLRNAKEQQYYPDIRFKDLFGTKTIDFSPYPEVLFNGNAVTVTDTETRKKILKTLGSTDYFTISRHLEKEFEQDCDLLSLENPAPEIIAELINLEFFSQNEDQELSQRPLGTRPYLALSLAGDLEENSRVSVHFDDEKEFLSLLPCFKQVYPESYDLTFDLSVEKDDIRTTELFMALYSMDLGNISLSFKSLLQSDAQSKNYDFIYVAPESTKRTDLSAIKKEQFRFQDAMPKFTGWLWVQKVYDSLAESGCGAVVLDRSALSRGGEEQKIRERIIERGILESIILFPKARGKNVIKQDCMLVLRPERPKAEQDSVLIINAEDIPEDWEYFVEYINSLDGDSVGIARVVPVDEIRDKEYDVDPWLYVVPSVGAQRKGFDPKQVSKKFVQQAKDIEDWIKGLCANYDELPPEEGKLTEIGYISENEARVRNVCLKEISVINSGSHILSGSERKPNMINAQDFNESGQFTGASGIATQDSKQRIRKGDILFRIPQPEDCLRPTDMPLWIFCYELMIDRYYSKEFLLIRANSKKVVPEYLHRYLCDSPAGKRIGQDLALLPCVDSISRSTRRFKKYIGNITVPLMSSLEDQQMVLEKMKEFKEFLNLWKKGQAEAQEFFDDMMIGMFMGDFTAHNKND